MCEPRRDTILNRFRALPGRQRVLLGLMGMALSGSALYFDSLGQKQANRLPPHELAAQQLATAREKLAGNSAGSARTS